MNQVRLTVRMPEKLGQDLSVLAAERGYSLNKLILEALWAFLNKPA